MTRFGEGCPAIWRTSQTSRGIVTTFAVLNAVTLAGWSATPTYLLIMVKGRDLPQHFDSTILQKGMWKIVHVHNSSPVSNMQSMGYEIPGIEDLLDAALAAPTNLPKTGIATIMFTDIADSTVIAENDWRCAMVD